MKRKLAAILSADVQGYSRLMGDDEEATIRTLTIYREVMGSLIQHHRGRVVDSPGDNLLAEFASAVDAVQGAVAIQQELKTRNAELPDHRKMAYRIGINVGDVVVEGERIYGDGVNIAARIESLADGGGISISEAVHMQVENKLDVAFSSQGEQTVKNIAKPVRVYKVELAAETIPHPAVLEQSAELPLPDKPSIAVLPFTNMSNDPEQEYFSDGMTDDIITDLSKISGLFVIARNSTFTYKGQAVKIADVGKELGVRHVLEGSVRKAGTRVRINVQLIDAPTGGHVWAERYDRELEDIFAVQDEIRLKVVFALKVTLSPEEHTRFLQAPTPSLDAYDAYLQGVSHFWRNTQEENVQAQRLFEHALSLDAQYAAAYAYLAYIHGMGWAFLWHEDPRGLDRAYELAQQALLLDDTLPVAHTALGVVLLNQGQHDQALAEVEQALALDPNYANECFTVGYVLNLAGLPQRALGVLEQGIRRNPHSPDTYLQQMALAYRLTGQFERAIATYKRILLRNPNHMLSHFGLAVVYSVLGREAEAKAEVAELLRINPHLSLDVVQRISPFKDPAVIEQIVVALRKAGLK